MTPGGPDLDRRDLLRLGAAGLVGVTLSACGESPSADGRQPAPDARRRGRVLLVSFSRAGENYHYGGRRDLRVGNTQVLAGMLAKRLDCDWHRIRAARPYPHDYEETRARNVREQDANARPAIANRLQSLARYDTVILASPLWNVRPPMIMRTFTDRYDFTGKTVLPVTTHAISGLGDAPDEYRDACEGAEIGRGLAVRGEQVRKAGPAVDAWLRRTA